jgi:Ulp1 family protease
VKKALQDAARNAHVGRANQYYDSNSEYEFKVWGELETFERKSQSQKDEFKDRNGTHLIINQTSIPTHFDDYKCVVYDKSPQQINSCDCGIFTVRNAYILARNGFDLTSLTYDQTDVTRMKYRERIANYLLSLNLSEKELR